MINGFIISQMTANLQGEPTAAQPSASTGSGVSFQSLLGGMIGSSPLTNGSQAGTAMPVTADSSQLINDPAQLLAGISLDKAGKQVPQAIKQLIEFLNQASGEQFNPLNIVINLQDISPEQLEALQSMGMDLSESVSSLTAVLNSSVLEEIKAQVSANGGEAEIQVNGLFNSEGELLSGLSALNATLTVAIPSNEQMDSSGSANSNLVYSLNLFPNRNADSSTLTDPKALEPISDLLDQGDESWISGLTILAGQLRALVAGAPSGVDSNSPHVSVMGAFISEDNLGDTGSAVDSGQTDSADGIQTSSVFGTAGDQMASAPREVAAGSGQDENGSLFSEDILQTLTDLVGSRLEQSAELKDPRIASRIVSMLENLAGMKDFSAGQQLAAIESLIGELESFSLEKTGKAGIESVIMGGTSADVVGLSGEISGQVPVNPEHSSSLSTAQSTIDAIQRVLQRMTGLRNLLTQNPAGKEITASGKEIDQSSTSGELRSVTEQASKLAGLIESLVSGQERGSESTAESSLDNTYQRQNSTLGSLLERLAGTMLEAKHSTEKNNLSVGQTQVNGEALVAENQSAGDKTFLSALASNSNSTA
ncbi:hypothetical protein ACFL5K_02375, partial [Gemmatimonadota bacterium]